jgi:hypothetical protein
MRLLLLVLAACCLAPGGPAEAQPAVPTADVTIVSSRANQTALDEQGVEYRKGVQFWASVCDQAGLSYRIAGDYELETELRESALYVLHRVERLSEAQRANLKLLVDRGAGVVLSGMTGSLDLEGNNRKSLAEEWLDITELAPYAPQDNAYFAALWGTPFSAAHSPGFRFEFNWSGRYFLGHSPWGTAFNVDWSLYPFPKKEDLLANSVMAMRTLGKSRVVWFGISPDDVVPKEEHQTAIKASLASLLTWAARKPVAMPCHWRGCRQSAAVVTADVEDQFQTGDAIALACHKEGVKGSWFLVGSLAPGYPEVVTALAANGEVGTHSVNHGSFKGVPLADQKAELAKGKKILEELGVSRVFGFRPPMEEYDEATIEAVAETGLGFIYGNLSFDRAFPIVRQVGGSNIYQFARIVADDYNLVVQRGVKNPTEYRREYLKEFRRLHDLGGLFPFSFHTNYLALADSVDVVRATIAELKKEDVWLTTFQGIVQWLETHRMVEIKATLQESTTVVSVANKGGAEIKAFSLVVFLPSTGEQPRLVATPEDGVKLTPKGEGRVALEVDLGGSETKVIKIR